MTSAMNLPRTLLWMVALIALSGAIASAPVSAQNKRQYVFLGDMPYTKKQRTRLQETIGPAIIAANFPFVVHLGDFKSGGKPCRYEKTLEAYKDISGLWQKGAARANAPMVFYTPGDNEWTDCDRPSDPKVARPELSMLMLLRDVFYYRNPLNPPESFRYLRQDGYPENARWRHHGVQFVTLHMVGTNNGRDEIDKYGKDIALHMVEARDHANAVWLEQAFNAAISASNETKAIIIATHTDVTDKIDRLPCSETKRTGCDAFANFRTELRKLASAFDKPVLLVHGSTWPYCMDTEFGKPEAGEPKASKLWRLNVSGDIKKKGKSEKIDATVITYDPNSADVPFSAAGLINGQKPDPGCPSKHN